MLKEVKALVLRAAGTNCDRETVWAFESEGASARSAHINALASGAVDLNDFHILALAGGFSYGDDVSAGKILANELSRKLSSQVDRFIKDGKLIIGICNGFQVLVKTGLLPGFDAREGSSGLGDQRVTLFDNDCGHFVCRWVHLKLAQNSNCVFTRGLPEVITLPIAHGEGKLIFDSAKTKKKMWDGGQAVFQYVDAEGNPGSFPINPNGAEDDLAAVCNSTGRVFGLMPHPERHVRATQHPRWTRGEAPAFPHGRMIFKNAVSFAKKEL